MKEQPFTMKQAAAYCGKEYETFRYWINRKRGPEFVIMDNRKVFYKDALDAWKPDDQRHKTKYGY